MTASGGLSKEVIESEERLCHKKSHISAPKSASSDSESEVEDMRGARMLLTPMTSGAYSSFRKRRSIVHGGLSQYSKFLRSAMESHMDPVPE